MDREADVAARERVRRVVELGEEGALETLREPQRADEGGEPGDRVGAAVGVRVAVRRCDRGAGVGGVAPAVGVGVGRERVRPCRDLDDVRDAVPVVVDVAGVRRTVNISCILDEQHPPEACLGEWVLVHVGFAMSRIDPEEAQRTIALLAELGEAQGEIQAMRVSGAK